MVGSDAKGYVSFCGCPAGAASLRLQAAKTAKKTKQSKKALLKRKRALRLQKSVLSIILLLGFE
jgi:hypothetical protein